EYPSFDQLCFLDGEDGWRGGYNKGRLLVRPVLYRSPNKHDRSNDLDAAQHAETGVIEFRERGDPHRRHEVRLPGRLQLARYYDCDVRSEVVDHLRYVGLHTHPDRDQKHHGADADDHAEHGQGGSKPVLANRPERARQILSKVSHSVIQALRSSSSRIFRSMNSRGDAGGAAGSSCVSSAFTSGGFVK